MARFRVARPSGIRGAEGQVAEIQSNQLEVGQTIGDDGEAAFSSGCSDHGIVMDRAPSDIRPMLVRKARHYPACLAPGILRWDE